MPQMFKLHQHVQTVCKIYVGLQKGQMVNLTRMAPEAIGQIKGIEVDKDFNIQYYIVRFEVVRLNGKKYYFWAKLSGNMIKEHI